MHDRGTEHNLYKVASLHYMLSHLHYMLPHVVFIFSTLILTQGWGSAGGGGNGNTANVPFSSGLLQQSSMRTSTGPAGAGITIAPGDINYVVERCEVSKNSSCKSCICCTCCLNMSFGSVTFLSLPQCREIEIEFIHSSKYLLCSPP